MSTPSTATATHTSHQHYGYPHSSYQATTSYPASTTAAGARLHNPYAYAVPSPTTTTLPYAQSSRIAPATSTPSGMTSHQSGSSAAPSQGGRRKKPDWGEFYKNGIPKEVIVIDDSPAPEASKAAPVPPAHSSSAAQPPMAQPAGKRRRTGLGTAYDLGYYDRPTFSTNPQQYGDNSSHSLSTDRTTSLHTTAPTSLGSQGSSGVSNGVYNEDATVGQKRKRTTRKSARDEQKRREEETVGDAFLSYVPPPKPPIKAKDVPVPVVRDVSISSSPSKICVRVRSTKPSSSRVHATKSSMTMTATMS
jgi:dual-specificity kinase